MACKAWRDSESICVSFFGRPEIISLQNNPRFNYWASEFYNNQPSASNPKEKKSMQKTISFSYCSTSRFGIWNPHPAQFLTKNFFH